MRLLEQAKTISPEEAEAEMAYEIGIIEHEYHIPITEDFPMGKYNNMVETLIRMNDDHKPMNQQPGQKTPQTLSGGI